MQYKVRQLLEEHKAILAIGSLVFLAGLILSFFRCAVSDELNYLHETMVMADAFREGHWIGNEWVGCHGFLFKLPVAFLFLLLGNSVWVATFFNILLSTLCVFLAYALALKWTDNQKLPACCSVLLFASIYYYVHATPSYLREIPVIFSSLLFFNAFLGKKRDWWSGLFLLLILDAKEHIFFQIVPGLVVFLIYDAFKERGFKILLIFLRRFVALILPSLVFLFLMFSTSLLPINLFNAYILGMVDGSYKVMESFSSEQATYNYSKSKKRLSEPSHCREQKCQGLGKVTGTIWGFLYALYRLLLSYLGKLFYPQTFSFLSIPKVVFVPAFITALGMFFREFREKWRQRDNERLALFFCFFSFLFFYFFRASIGRYLLGISFLVTIFFLEFLRNEWMEKKLKSFFIITITGLLIYFSFGFEESHTKMKIILNTYFMTLLVLGLFFRGGKAKPLLIGFFVVSMAGVTFSSAILASATLPQGQINNFRKFGYNCEVDKIMEAIPEKVPFWLNGGLSFILAHKNSPKIPILEDEFPLKDWVPKKDLILDLSTYPKYHFSEPWENIDHFHQKVQDQGIQYVGLIISTVEGTVFSHQGELKRLKEANWLHLKKQMYLKNKIFYLFQVIEKPGLDQLPRNGENHAQ